jgi:hypothetical protein
MVWLEPVATWHKLDIILPLTISSLLPATAGPLSPRYNTCAAPQEVPQAQVVHLLEDEVGKRHVAASQRPSLDQCSEKEFEKDLITLLRARGERDLVPLIIEQRVTW